MFYNPAQRRGRFYSRKKSPFASTAAFFLSPSAYNFLIDFLIDLPIRFISQNRREHKPNRRKNFGGLV